VKPVPEPEGPVGPVGQVKQDDEEEQEVVDVDEQEVSVEHSAEVWQQSVIF
jgi:hypothetical protein